MGVFNLYAKQSMKLKAVTFLSILTLLGYQTAIFGGCDEDLGELDENIPPKMAGEPDRFGIPHHQGLGPTQPRLDGLVLLEDHRGNEVRGTVFDELLNTPEGVEWRPSQPKNSKEKD